MASTLAMANCNSLPLDWAARLSVGGVSLSLFIAKQLPILPPEAYLKQSSCGLPYAQMIAPRALELTYTSYDTKANPSYGTKNAATVCAANSMQSTPGCTHSIEKTWNTSSTPPSPVPPSPPSKRKRSKSSANTAPRLMSSPPSTNSSEEKTRTWIPQTTNPDRYRSSNTKRSTPNTLPSPHIGDNRFDPRHPISPDRSIPSIRIFEKQRIEQVEAAKTAREINLFALN